VPVAAHDQEIASDASGVRQDHIGYIHFSRNNVRELDLEAVPSEMMRNIDAGDLVALGGLIGSAYSSSPAAFVWLVGWRHIGDIDLNQRRIFRNDPPKARIHPITRDVQALAGGPLTCRRAAAIRQLGQLS
jgi:hypothetical protein